MSHLVLMTTYAALVSVFFALLWRRGRQQQAKLYADCLEAQFGQRPLIFYSNGYEHWLWDDTQASPRSVQGFHTKDELALMIQRRNTKVPLADLPIADEIVERYYQQRAIRAIGYDMDYTLVNTTTGVVVAPSQPLARQVKDGDVLEVQPVLVAGAGGRRDAGRPGGGSRLIR